MPVAASSTQFGSSETTGSLGSTMSKPMGPEAVYRLAKVGEKSAAGIMKMTSPQFPDFVPPHWMSYIAVDNVDSRFEKALALGGEGIHPPTDIPEVGRFCIIKDPTGAAIALLTPTGGTA
jgi:predicted enzyme related to lactoylglutathione lyase